MPVLGGPRMNTVRRSLRRRRRDVLASSRRDGDGLEVADDLGSGREAPEDGEPGTCVQVFDQLPVAGIPVIVARRVGEAGRLLGNGEQFVGIQGNQAVGITDGVAEQIESAHPLGMGEIGCGLRGCSFTGAMAAHVRRDGQLATPLLTGRHDGGWTLVQPLLVGGHGCRG